VTPRYNHVTFAVELGPDDPRDGTVFIVGVGEVRYEAREFVLVRRVNGVESTRTATLTRTERLPGSPHWSGWAIPQGWAIEGGSDGS
jgi:hypothetical protein